MTQTSKPTDATADAYLAMVELKQKYELEADKWKSIAHQQALRATEFAKECDTLRKDRDDWRSLAEGSDKAIDAGTKRISELMQEIASLQGDKEAYAETMREACRARDQADAELKALRQKVSTWLRRIKTEAL